jgi:hypothetical protein
MKPLTVRQLIEELRRHDQDALVLIDVRGEPSVPGNVDGLAPVKQVLLYGEKEITLVADEGDY